MELTEKEILAVNNWMKRWVRPFIRDDCKVAFLFLRRYVRDKPAGNPVSFASRTLFHTEQACLTIAESLVGNPSATLEMRASAMTQMVAYCIANPRATRRVDIEATRCLLQEEVTTGMDRREVVRLARMAAMSEELWQDAHEEIEMAIRKIGQDFNVEVSPSRDRHSLIMDAEKCMRAWSRLAPRYEAIKKGEA